MAAADRLAKKAALDSLGLSSRKLFTASSRVQSISQIFECCPG